MDLELADKTALVTGASKGIGLGIAQALATEGATVVICARGAEEVAQATDELQTSAPEGTRVLGVTADLQLADDRAALVNEVVSRAQGVDILVNNAGSIGDGGHLDETSLDEWHQLFELNLFAAVQLSREVLPGMRQRGWGRIINISSENGTQPYPDMLAYSATKSALDNVTKALSKQESPHGILVNTVSPAFIRTPAVEDMLAQQASEQDISLKNATERFLLHHRPGIGVGRPGEPHEVGSLVAFLASDRASFINGANYRVDGGSVHTV